MVLTVLTKISRRFNLSGFILLCLLQSASLAAELGGGISVGASHTDNVFLAVSPNEVDDVVYQASPFLTFLHESPQLNASLDYGFDWYRYSDLSATSKYHRGEASLASRLWEDSLTTEIGFRRSQTLKDPQNVIPIGALPLSGNIIDQDEWWFNPQFSRKIGSAVTIDAGYEFSKIGFGDPVIQDNDNQSGQLAINNYSAGEGLTWALRYDWRRTEYEISAPWEFQRAAAELGVWASSSTRVFGSGGVESAWDNPVDPALDESFWEVGFAYTPSDSLSAEFAIGDRSFGSSWRGSLDYEFRRGSTSLSYDESPTTTGFDRNSAARPILDSGSFGEFLDQPGSSERFLSKQFQWTLDLEFRRSAFNLSVFDESRSGRISADGIAGEDQSQSGATALFSWRAGVRTEFAFMTSVVERETGLGEGSRFTSAGIDITYRVGTRSDISLGYTYSDQQPNINSVATEDYVANVVSLFFTYTM